MDSFGVFVAYPALQLAAGRLQQVAKSDSRVWIPRPCSNLPEASLGQVRTVHDYNLCAGQQVVGVVANSNGDVEDCISEI